MGRRAAGRAPRRTSPRPGLHCARSASRRAPGAAAGPACRTSAASAEARTGRRSAGWPRGRAGRRRPTRCRRAAACSGSATGPPTPPPRCRGSRPVRSTHGANATRWVGCGPDRRATSWASPTASPPPAESPISTTPCGGLHGQPLEQVDEPGQGVLPGVRRRERVVRQHDAHAEPSGQPGGVLPVVPVQPADEATAVQVEHRPHRRRAASPASSNTGSPSLSLRRTSKARAIRRGGDGSAPAWRASTSRRTCSGSCTSLRRRITGITLGQQLVLGTGHARRLQRAACRLGRERQGSATRR